MIKNKGKKTFLNGNNFLIHKTRPVFQHADGLLELLSLLRARKDEGDSIPFCGVQSMDRIGKQVGSRHWTHWE